MLFCNLMLPLVGPLIGIKKFYSTLLYSTLLYSILFYSILFFYQYTQHKSEENTVVI